MENLDLMVLRSLRDWRSQGTGALLATVVRTWGSSPRPVGSSLALREDGHLVGSVSGGCIEDDLIFRFGKPGALAADGGGPATPPTFLKYGITADEAHRFGLPCGGTLELVLEFNPDPQGLGQLVESLGAGRLMRRTLRFADGAVTTEAADTPEALRFGPESMTNRQHPDHRADRRGQILVGPRTGAVRLPTRGTPRFTSACRA